MTTLSLGDPAPCNQLLATLPSAEWRRLSAFLEPRQLQEGQLLEQPGQPVQQVYFPTSALLSWLTRVDVTLPVTLALMGRDGMTGIACMVAKQAAPFHAQVLIEGQALCMTAPVFIREFAESADFRKAVLRHLLSLTAQIAQNAGCYHFHLLEPRLARWLLMVRDLLGSAHFHMTHETLAQLLGVRRVGVTLAAHALKQRQLIHYSRGAMEILDGDGLQRCACSCYRRAVYHTGG
ncbi:MAG: Crp/Fnr family transcriptional regulator [Rhodoferax sp.]|nr:Crp/Fnr family transcriptional regulator [Rhodoferax sp.]